MIKWGIFTIFGIILLAIFVMLGFKLLGSFGNSMFGTGNFSSETKVTVNNHQFLVAVAKSPEEKQKGLTEKESLPENMGMLFIFDGPDYQSFWTKNMKFPIDILFINKDHIVTIYQNAKPATSDQDVVIYKPEEPADMVFEINGGLSQKYGFQKNDKVEIK